MKKRAFLSLLPLLLLFGLPSLASAQFPSVMPGTVKAITDPAVRNGKYQAIWQGQLAGQSGSNDFLNGAGGVYDPDRDEYAVFMPGGDQDGANNGVGVLSVVSTQLWSLPRPATKNLIPYNQGGHLPAGVDGASFAQGTVGLVSTLADGATGDVALTDVSQFSSTGGLALLCIADGSGPILARQELVRYDSKNSGAKTIHITHRHVRSGGTLVYSHSGSYAALDTVTPFGTEARPGSLRVYIDTLGLYGPANDPFPASNHTYGAITYLKSVKRFWWQTSAKWFQGSAYPENGEYDPATHRFTYNASDPNTDWYPGAASTWDSTQYRAIFNGSRNLQAYDPAKPAGRRISIVRALSGGDTNQVHRSLYDPVRRRVVYIGVKRDATWSVPGISYCHLKQDGTGDAFVDVPGRPAAALAAFGADVAIGGSSGAAIPVWLYQPVLDKYLYYPSFGQTFYYLDPDSGAVTTETFTGDTYPDARPAFGAGWFAVYVPSQDVVLIPEVGSTMQMGKMYAFRSGLKTSRSR
jgi:hypothetical protein